MEIVPSLVASTFGIIFLAELPDKTAFATLILATRYGTRSVFFGSALAFLVQTLVAVIAGSVLQLLPEKPVRLAAGVGFIVFAALALLHKELEEEQEEEVDVERVGSRRLPGWVASFLVVFAAEWGDLTQLATAALVAQTRQPLSVGLGSVAALWCVSGIATVAGSQVGKYLNPVLLQRISAVLFAAIGIFIIATTLAGG